METVFDVAGRLKRISEYETQMSAPGFWDNPQKAQDISRKIKQIKDVVGTHQSLTGKTEDLEVLIELSEEAQDASQLAEIQREATTIEHDLDKFELACTLNGPHDGGDCFVNIHPGAGGTEACDWASMLFRMYTRWIERQEEFKAEIIDLLPGDEAGIKNVTIQVSGPYAYGYLKSESGVHRLVRISPFDANARRHTSFVSVHVTPVIDDASEIEIDEKDLRIDTYRSSGHGGQHVNTTDSAVRITHIPTGLVTQCQNERSQHQNKFRAMQVMRSRLFELRQEEIEKEREKVTGVKKKIEWGSQIRSYVFQPYQMVKDIRTRHETGNIQSVMDGEIDPFIDAYLRWQLTGAPEMEADDDEEERAAK